MIRINTRLRPRKGAYNISVIGICLKTCSYKPPSRSALLTRGLRVRADCNVQVILTIEKAMVRWAMPTLRFIPIYSAPSMGAKP